jgi:adenosylhomocysteine nucleosidase
MAQNALKPEDILIVMALEKEGGERLEPLGFPVLYCGLGKVNATYALSKALSATQPKLILNLGTAGSSVFAKGQLVACHHFNERE